jgi:signal transduction histidine kinase
MSMHTAPILQSTTRRFDPFGRHRSGPVLRYAVAVLLVGAAFLTTITLKNSAHSAYYQTPFFFCAIVLSSWFGGFGSGICSTLLSMLLLRSFFPSLASLSEPATSEIPRFAVFFLAGGFISWLGDRQRRDELALMRSRGELEEKVQARTAALTAANERLTAEIGDRTRAELELRRLNRAWRVHNACNQAVTRYMEESELLEQVCREVVEVEGYRLVWVGFAEGDKPEFIRIVAQAGEAQHFLDDLVVYCGADESRIGPAGTAIRTAQPVACNELSSNPRFVPWRVRAEAYGLNSLVSLPLTVDGIAIGALVIYSEEPAAFDEKETELLQQAATDLTHGVILLRTKLARRRAEEALDRTKEELGRIARVTTMGELTASIAHEVNQPLAAVVTNANASLRWLSADPPNFDEAREAIQRIVRDGNRAGDVIARIRALLRKGEPEARRLDLNDAIREVVAVVQSEAGRRGESLQTDLAANLPAITGDRVQLQQVLLNLIINALDAMNAVTDRPRAVCIRTSAPEPKLILVAVEDSGVGIDPEKAARLFDSFFTTKQEGLGMGLSISRSIVEAHRGRLWATPNEGPGATFQFTLPVDGGAEA